MADNSIVFNLKLDNEQFAAQLGAAQKRLLVFGQKMRSLGRDLSFALTVPLVATGKAAADTASEFSLIQARIKGIGSGSGANLDALTKQALDLGKTTRFTATEVAELQLELIKLGKGAITQQVTEPILRLANAFDLDLGESAKSVGRIINVFSKDLSTLGDASEQANFVVNALANTAAKTSANVEGLTTSFGYVAADAAALNLSFSDTVALLGLLSDRGFDASRGGTSLRRVFAQLAKDGKTGNDVVAALFDNTGSYFELLEEFGLRGAGPAAGLQGVTEQFQKLKEVLGDTTVLQETSDLMDKSLFGALKRVSSAANAVSIAFFEANPIIIGFLNALAGLLRAISELNPIIQNLVIAIGALAAAVGPVLFLMSQAALAAEAMGLSVTFAAGGVSALLGPVAVATAAVLGLVVAFTALYKSANAGEIAFNDFRDSTLDLETNQERLEAATKEVIDVQNELRALNREANAISDRSAVSGRISSSDAARSRTLANEIEQTEKRLKLTRAFFYETKKAYDLETESLAAAEAARRQQTKIALEAAKRTEELTRQQALLKQQEEDAKAIAKYREENPEIETYLIREKGLLEDLVTLQRALAKDKKETAREELLLSVALARSGEAQDKIFKENVNKIKARTKEIQDNLKEYALTVQQEISTAAIAIGNSLVSAFDVAVQERSIGSFFKEIGRELLVLLKKVVALTIAFGILKAVAGFGGLGNIATQAGKLTGPGQFLPFIGSGLGFGGIFAGPKSSGVVSGSDLVFVTNRGITATDRIYG